MTSFTESEIEILTLDELQQLRFVYIPGLLMFVEYRGYWLLMQRVNMLRWINVTATAM
jgi:hypothetical protein